jgi:hypothetical protein
VDWSAGYAPACLWHEYADSELEIGRPAAEGIAALQRLLDGDEVGERAG